MLRRFYQRCWFIFPIGPSQKTKKVLKGPFSTRYTTYISNKKPWKVPLRTRDTIYISDQFFCLDFVIVSKFLEVVRANSQQKYNKKYLEKKSNIFTRGIVPAGKKEEKLDFQVGKRVQIKELWIVYVQDTSEPQWK